MIAGQSIVQMHFPDRDAEVHADGESRDAGKESRQYEQAAEEFREGRNVAQPVGKTKTRHEVSVVMQASENFVVAMHDHNGAQGQTHEKKRKWLQAFRVAQGDLRVRHQITADQITAKKRYGVKMDEQNDCVAAQLLVTFFRPLSETCESRETAIGQRETLRVMSRVVVACSAGKYFSGLAMWTRFARAVPHRRSGMHRLHEFSLFRVLRFQRDSSTIRVRDLRGSSE